MFEVGFSELLLIFVIGLVVLGPQKLPKLVAQVGRWAGKARAMARQFREQLENEINLEELNKAPSKPATPAPEPMPAAEPTPWAEPTATTVDATATEAPAEEAVTPVAEVPVHHEHTIHAAPPPETQGDTPIIETHEHRS